MRLDVAHLTDVENNNAEEITSPSIDRSGSIRGGGGGIRGGGIGGGGGGPVLKSVSCYNLKTTFSATSVCGTTCNNSLRSKPT